uniref:Uncharacterized protein n=1 Tax=Nelumbo nucifera TaxID=4432 RepID=A0A822ZK99_NELNU|nr:TPA_asm: hypothetical protein HUJ06_003383 [Nelumbo nucifera]
MSVILVNFVFGTDSFPVLGTDTTVPSPVSQPDTEGLKGTSMAGVEEGRGVERRTMENEEADRIWNLIWGEFEGLKKKEMEIEDRGKLKLSRQREEEEIGVQGGKELELGFNQGNGMDKIKVYRRKNEEKKKRRKKSEVERLRSDVEVILSLMEVVEEGENKTRDKTG